MTVEQFKAKRIKLGLTQAELAARLGYSTIAISFKEQGLRKINNRDEKMMKELK